MTAPEQMRAVVVANRVLAPHTFVLRLSGCESLRRTRPGQFAMVRFLDAGTDPLLPRAFSLLAVTDRGEADILIKTSGKASALLERALPGSELAVLGPLGNGFPEPSPDESDWLIAGGVGLAPLLMYAHTVGAAEGLTMFYGGRSAADLVLLDDIRSTGARLVLATEDGSVGYRGYVTGAVTAELERRAGRAPRILACGPEPMLEAVAALAHRHQLSALLSLEGEMACGIGACLVCAVACKTRPFRYTCVDGPVFDLAELGGHFAATGSGTP